MRFLFFPALISWLSVLFTVLAAAEQPTTPTPSPTPTEPAAEAAQPAVRVLTPGPVEMEGMLRLGVYGALAKEIDDELNKDPGGVAQHLQLYLNGVLMAGLTPVIAHPSEDGTASGAKPTYELEYFLNRLPDVNENRAAWDNFLSSLAFGRQKIQAGVGLQGRVPYLTSGKDLLFQVRPPEEITAVIAAGFIAFFLLAWRIVTGNMLREAGRGTTYSLGKSQMAFWGLIVALSFLCVWVISYRMERIPPQTLTLIGISAVTGLSSMLIGDTKRSSAAEQKAQLLQQKADLDAQQDKLQTAQTKLTQANRPEAAAAAGKDARVAAINLDLSRVENEQAKAVSAIAEKTESATPPRTTGNWFVDVISDANGPSFHRFQVVLWTLILGSVFVWNVANKLSMPEFDTTLLLLMGISNGTYIGFKIPEKPGPKVPDENEKTNQGK